mgnify:CR=1 FL=1
MEITPLHEDNARSEELIREGWARRQSRDAPRAEGPHVSKIVNDWVVTAGLAKPWSGGSGDNFDLESMSRMTMGFIWEDLVGDYIAAYFHRVTQIPVVMDGIHGTIDAIDTQNNVVEEYKATWRGEERAIQDGIRWWTQIKAYCLMVRTKEARLRVLHLCPVPRIRTYKLKFSDQELAENWLAIRNHWDYMTKKVSP